MIDFPEQVEAERDFEPYLRFFNAVPTNAWIKTLRDAPSRASVTSRKNLVWDEMADSVRTTAPDYGLRVVELKRGRRVPIVLVPGKNYEYAVRFNCLSDELRAGGISTRQRRLFESQEPVGGDRPIPGLVKPTVNIRAGYVLDAVGIAIDRTPIVLSIHDRPVWAFDAPPAGEVGEIVEITAPSAPGGLEITSTKEATDSGTGTDGTP